MRLSSHYSASRRRNNWKNVLPVLLLGTQYASAISLDITDPGSIKNAAATVAYDLIKDWYYGNQTGNVPGNLPAPYYWWECGAMFMTLIEYWAYTGDDSYVNITTQALQWQSGPNADFMTPNQTRTTGNDDQSFWAFAAMDAAELKFPNPPADEPQWLALVQAVFNDQATRWKTDAAYCNGGLRWQVFQFNIGYNYKNSISNGCFFSLGARLARYTGNETYADWANKAWDWVQNIGLMNQYYQIYDGTDIEQNCTQQNHNEWTYNVGVFLHGAANMWNRTQDPIWKTRVDGLITGMNIFFTKNIMYEVACEPHGNCNNDMQSYKAYLSRWMAATIQLCPWTRDQLMPLLQASAQGAALSCTGGTDGATCGEKWYTGSFDGITGPGEQMTALSVFGSLLIDEAPYPVTADTGGTSKGDPGAGGGTSLPSDIGPVSTADRAGAGIITILILTGIVAGAWWMVK